MRGVRQPQVLTNFLSTSPAPSLKPICRSSSASRLQPSIPDQSECLQRTGDSLARCRSLTPISPSTTQLLTQAFCALRTAWYRSRCGSENFPETGNVRVMSDA